LTLGELRTGGLLGCGTCYVVFAREVEVAIEALHAVAPPEAAHPWPTRRAVRPAADGVASSMAPRVDTDVN